MHNPSLSARARSLTLSLAQANKVGLSAGVSGRLRTLVPPLAARLNEAVLRLVPAFSASANPDIVPGLASHTAAIAEAFVAMFEEAKAPDFAFAHRQARQWADQRFPLEAILQSYRQAEDILHDAALHATIKGRGNDAAAVTLIQDIVREFTGSFSAATTSEYVAHTRHLAETESDLRTELLSLMLSGFDESDQRVAKVLRQAGYLEQRLSYCVVVVQSAIPAEMEGEARAQRLISAVSDVLADAPIRKLAGLRDNLAVFILSDRRRQSGWTAATTPLADRLHDMLLLLGPAVRVGLSTDHPSSSFIRRAWDEARTALSFTSVDRRVVSFGRLSVRNLLLHFGAPGMTAAPPPWHLALAEADTKSSGILVKTLLAVADANMNVQEAARALNKHPNTLYARLERIHSISGLDARRFHDLNELLLAADCWRPPR